MRKFSHIVISIYEQKSAKKREALLSFLKQWNQEKEIQFRDAEDLGIAWDIYLSDIDSNPIFLEVTQALETLADKEGIIYHKVVLISYDEADYDKADFIGLSAISLYDQGTPFFLNEDTATPYKICPECKDQEYGGIFEQVETFKLDESLITIQLNHTPKDPADTWDIISLQGGHLIISAKCRLFLEQQQAKGYSLHPVYNAEGEISKKLFQLKADKVIVVPYYQTLGTTEFYCTTCGVLQIPHDRHFFDLDPKEIGSLDFFAQNISRSSNIYISNKLYKNLKTGKINGMIPDGIINFH